MRPPGRLIRLAMCRWTLRSVTSPTKPMQLDLHACCQCLGRCGSLDAARQRRTQLITAALSLSITPVVDAPVHASAFNALDFDSDPNAPDKWIKLDDFGWSSNYREGIERVPEDVYHGEPNNRFASFSSQFGDHHSLIMIWPPEPAKHSTSRSRRDGRPLTCTARFRSKCCGRARSSIPCSRQPGMI